jgi:DNA-binding transcriptional ArsR family regulator/predicted nucleotidyltransferase
MLENNATTDLAMGRSSVRRRILTVLAQPETRLHLREIQRRAGTSPGTASRELGRLLAAGLIEREAEGNQVYFRGATTPLATMLRSLLAGSVAAPLETGTPLTPSPSETAGKSSPTARSSHVPPAAGPAAAPDAPPPDIARQAAAAAPDELGLRVAAQLADRIRPTYGKRLLGIYLYGARARGEARPDSNVDVLLVLDSVARYCDELEQTSVACADLSQEEGLVVSRMFVSETAWLTRSDGQMPAIRKEAVAI